MNVCVSGIENQSGDIYDPQNGKARSGRIKEHLKGGLRKVATFIYETPVSVVALTVSGIALLIIFPRFASPLLGLAGSTVLARLVVIIIDAFDFQRFANIKERVYEYHEKHPKMQYIAFLVAVVICTFSSIGGFVVSVGIGIYKGMIVEIDIYKYKQELRREELKNPINESRVDIIIC
ncbi:MAG: hypothetical protein ACE5GN_07790 [Waddliaceae bacterium]